jgi:hypothetical protein
MDEAGLRHRMMNEVIQDVVANRKNNHPEYDAEAGDGQFNNADHTVDAGFCQFFVRS